MRPHSSDSNKNAWKDHPILVSRVVKLRPHPAAHPPKPSTRKYPPPPFPPEVHSLWDDPDQDQWSEITYIMVHHKEQANLFWKRILWRTCSEWPERHPVRGAQSGQAPNQSSPSVLQRRGQKRPCRYQDQNWLLGAAGWWSGQMKSHSARTHNGLWG